MAIFVAIYVPWRQRRHQLQDSARQAKEELDRQQALIGTMKVALFRPVDDFRAQCRLTAQLIREKKAGQTLTLPSQVFERPPEFDQFRTSLHLLGALGHKINLIITTQDSLRTMVRGAVDQPHLHPRFVEKALGELDGGDALGTEVAAVLRAAIDRANVAQAKVDD